MSRKAVLVSAVASLLMSSSVVEAVVLTNRDDKEHKLTIVEGDARSERTVKPSEIVEGICPKGCVIRLNDSDDDEYELDGPETVSIEEGFLYYDGPEGQEESAPGASPPAATPPAATPPAATPPATAPSPATPPSAPKQ